MAQRRRRLQLEGDSLVGTSFRLSSPWPKRQLTSHQTAFPISKHQEQGRTSPLISDVIQQKPMLSLSKHGNAGVFIISLSLSFWLALHNGWTRPMANYAPPHHINRIDKMSRVDIRQHCSSHQLWLVLWTYHRRCHNAISLTRSYMGQVVPLLY